MSNGPLQRLFSLCPCEQLKEKLLRCKAGMGGKSVKRTYELTEGRTKSKRYFNPGVCVCVVGGWGWGRG